MALFADLAISVGERVYDKKSSANIQFFPKNSLDFSIVLIHSFHRTFCFFSSIFPKKSLTSPSQVPIRRASETKKEEKKNKPQPKEKHHDYADPR